MRVPGYRIKALTSIMVVVLIRDQKSGLTLPSAPEFGPNGLWPPAETEWLPLRWELFERKMPQLEALAAMYYFMVYRSNISEMDISEDAWLKDFCSKPSFPNSLIEVRFQKPHMMLLITCEKVLPEPRAAMSGIGTARPPLFGRTAELSDLRDVLLSATQANGLCQLMHSVRWRRKDPVTQLPPDATHEMTHTVTTGLSIEHSQTLAESLGLDLGGKAGLQTKLSYKLQEQFGLKLNITATEETSTKLTLSNQSKNSYRLFALWQ
jgi:hypothetical protein